MVLGRRGDPVWVVPAFERDRGLEQIRIGRRRARLAGGRVAARAPGARARRPRRHGPRRRRGGDAVRVLRRDRAGGAGAASRERDRRSRRVPDGEGRPRARAHAARLRRSRCAPTAPSSSRSKEGVTVADVAGWSAAAHRRLGARGGSLVLFGPDAAFPHGTEKPRPLHARGRGADRRRLPPPRLLERHHAHRRLRRGADRPPAADLGHRPQGPAGGLCRRAARRRVPGGRRGGAPG